MSRRWLSSIGLLLLALIVPIITVGWIAATAPPAAINESVNEAAITFTGKQNTVFWPTGCLTVTWDTSNIATISLNEEATVGNGEREVCVAPNKLPRLRVSLPDDTRLIYDLPVTIITAHRLFLMASVATIGLALLALLTTPPIAHHLRATDTPTRLHLMALALVMVAGIGLRAVYLDRPLYGDESFTVVRFASQPLDAIRADYSDVNNHVLHTMLVRLSIEGFGLAPWTMRLPAFLAGLLIVPLTYLAGRAWYGREAGLLAAGIAAVQPMLVVYSVNARGYTMVTACFIAMIWLAAYVRGRVRWWLWSLVALVAAVGFATLTVFLYPMVLAGVWWLIVALSERERRILKLGLFTGALTVGAFLTLWFYAPIMGNSGLAAFTSSGYVVRVPMSAAFGFAQGGILSLIDITVRWLPFGGWLTAGLFIGLVATPTQREVRPWLVAVTLIVLAVVLAVLRYPLHPRAWLFGIPLILIGGAAGIAWIIGRWRGGIAVTTLTVLLVAGYGAWLLTSDVMTRIDETGEAYGARETTLFFDELLVANPDTEIVLMPQFTADQPLRLYYEMLRLHPVPTHIDIQYGAQLTEVASRMVAGEPIALFALHAPVDGGMTPADYLWDAPPELQSAFTVETVATYQDGWMLRQLLVGDGS
jgi:hypothetical protein